MVVTNFGQSKLPEGSFPILLDISHEGPVDPDYEDPDGAPADIYLGTYVQSENPEEDYIELTRAVRPSPAHESQATLTPDGRVAFFSDRDGAERVYASHPRSTKPRPDLLIARDDLLEFKFSPDGQTMAFVAIDDRDEIMRSHLWLANPDGSEARRIPLGDMEPSELQFSPDGHSLLFQSQQWHGRNRGLYRLDLQSLETDLIAKGDHYCSRLSPDGKTVAFFQGDRLISRNLDTGEEKTVSASPPGWPSGLSHSPDGSRLIMTTGEPADWDGTDYWRTATYVIPAKGGRWNEVDPDLSGLLRLEALPTYTSAPAA